MQKVDYIIVGGGIAGCLMASELKRRDNTVVIFDDLPNPGASHIAAGSINPITGRKFVKSWKIDQLLESAKSVYGRIEEEYVTTVLHSSQIVRGLKTIGMQNDWSARGLDSDYQAYIDTSKELSSVPGIRDKYVGYCIVDKCYRADFQKVISLITQVSQSGIHVVDARFDSSSLQKAGDRVVYHDFDARGVIFAEGSAVRHNELWSWLPFVTAHGERLIIHAPELQMTEAFNDGKIIIPIGDDQYWVGSSYDWDIKEPITTQTGYDQLKAYLDDTLTVPYEILAHHGHVRPATYNRRPLVGKHPDHDNYYILNGMGTKGASLSPYCVEQLIALILDGTALDEEIDVSRVPLA